MTETYSDTMAYCRNRALSGAMAKLRRIGAIVALWHARHRQRRALLNLDAKSLSDIGISRRQAIDEANKPFWVGKLSG